MHDLKERLERLAEDGTPRGATDVMRAARRSLDGATPLGSPLVPQRSSRRPMVLAFVIVLLVALVVSSVLVFGGSGEKSRLVPVVPTPNGLQDLFDTSKIETKSSNDTLYLVPGYLPAGMQPIEVNSPRGPGVVESRGGSPEIDRAQLWVKLDPTGVRPVDRFDLSWGRGAVAYNDEKWGQNVPHTDDPLGYSDRGSVPTEVRGHRGFYNAKQHVLTWEEPKGQQVTLRGDSLAHDDLLAIADALEPRADGGFTVTQVPPDFVQVSEAKGLASDGTNARDASFQDSSGRGFRIRVAEDPESPPGQDLIPSLPSLANDPRLVEVRGRHAVFSRTVGANGGTFGPRTQFLIGADLSVQWLEPGNVMVTVSGVGLSEDEIMAIARGLRVVDAAGWDDLLVQAPGRSARSPSAPRSATPPTFTGEKAAVAAAYHAWLDARNEKNADAAAAEIEDGDRLRATFVEVQTKSAYLGVLSSRVDAVRLVGSDHALVTFSILANGVPTLSDQQGGAVRVNGRWLVSRATYCGVIALVGVNCPAP
jgi:hypothetical protein